MINRKIKITAAAFLTTAALCSCSNNIGHEENSKPEQTAAVTSAQQSSSADSTFINETTSRTSTVTDTDKTYICTSFKYEQLSGNEKNIYNTVCAGLSEHKETIELSTDITIDSFNRVYDAVLTTMETQMYCPTRTYQYSYTESDSNVSKIVPEYKYSADDTQRIHEEVEAAVSEVLSQVSSEMSQVDIVRLFHDYIINDCEYEDRVNTATDSEIEEMMHQSDYDNAYGVLVRHKGVCEGYARAFRYLCLRTGIECELVSGTSCGEGHMWNIVKLGSDWYHIDLTWDDPILYSGKSEHDNIRYNYFNLSDEKILTDHTIDSTYYQYPGADSDSANFFIYYGLYAQSAESADEIIKRELVKIYNNEERVIYIKAASEDVLSEIIQHLFEMNGLYDILSDIQDQADYLNDITQVVKAVDNENLILKIIL
ncbi:MAG: transglutaminase domain-containing protein [Oscillospiraceae bacterium]|nr:transglutaminase domain-containing protein [Oscillospiraceae bacterium]